LTAAFLTWLSTGETHKENAPMENIRIDVTGISDLKVNHGKQVSVGSMQPSLPLESKVLESMLRNYVAACGADGQTGVIGGLLRAADTPSIGIQFVGNVAAAPVRVSKDWTGAVGPTVSGGAGGIIDLSGGVYYWNKPQFGFYGSIAAGSFTNIGISGGVQFTYYFGAAPDVLKGDCWVVGVEVSGPGIITGGGYALFSIPLTHLIGISFMIGGGKSMLPYNVTVQYSHTWIT
jgi:hypothetical protein